MGQADAGVKMKLNETWSGVGLNSELATHDQKPSTLPLDYGARPVWSYEAGGLSFVWSYEAGTTLSTCKTENNREHFLTK